MTAPADLEHRIFRMLHDLTAIPADEIRVTDRLAADLGMDSVAQMELIGMFQEELSIDVDLEDTFRIETAGHVVELARRYLDKAA